MLDLWYKDAIIYSVDVETFADLNGDGIGDFAGLAGKLDYLAGLGINCLWLQPFYPSPNRDDGYDITDYYSVDPRLGSLGDFVEFAYQARQRGMRILVDLVINHTSDQHPWFLSARADENSPFRDFYVWSKDRPRDTKNGVVFPGVQKGVWTRDRKAKSWYFHRFYKHQPDLNIDNPLVQEEIEKIMGFWLQLGVSGFRLDAVPFLIQREGAEVGIEGDLVFNYLEELRRFISWRRGDAVLLGEANILPHEVNDYFGDGNRVQLLFNFYANQHLFLALATGRADQLGRAYDELPKTTVHDQWANFLRNHDELDLGRLSRSERQDVFEALSPDPDTHIYERGIRRRLAPMLGNDRRRLELAYSLIFSLPGTPVLRYGEEIGMGDDLTLPERMAVRTPMQWSPEPNGGFSDAPADALIRPVIETGEFGTKLVNVAAQQRDRNSLLNWMERMIRARRACHEIGWGTFAMIPLNHPAVFAHTIEWRGFVTLAFHNLSGEECEVVLPDDLLHHGFSEIFADSTYDPIGRGRKIALRGWGYRWLRDVSETARRPRRSPE